MVKHWIEYAFMRATFFVFGALPVDTASAIGGAIARAIGPHTRLHKHAQKTVALCLPNRADEHAQILCAMWDNLGRSYAEQPHAHTLSGAAHTHITVDANMADTIKNGAVFVSGHLANWELMPPSAMAQLGIHVHSAYRAPNNPLVDAWLKRLRAADGSIKTFSKTRRGAVEMVRALKNKECVGILADQKDNTGTVLEFFGLPAASNTTYAEMAVSVGVPIVFTTLRRTHGTQFESTIHALDTTGKTAQQIAQDVTTRLEAFIRQNPDQWLWVHRRFDKELYSISSKP